MKKLISTLSFILFVSAIVSAQCCGNATADNSIPKSLAFAEKQKSSEVKAYYFHSTRRCVTCEAVETVAKEAIATYYGDKVSFESINSEKEKDNSLVKKYDINGTTLLIVKGDKKVDLTNIAFLNARTNPDKFKSKIKSAIDSMM